MMKWEFSNLIRKVKRLLFRISKNNDVIKTKERLDNSEKFTSEDKLKINNPMTHQGIVKIEDNSVTISESENLDEKYNSRQEEIDNILEIEEERQDTSAEKDQEENNNILETKEERGDTSAEKEEEEGIDNILETKEKGEDTSAEKEDQEEELVKEEKLVENKEIVERCLYTRSELEAMYQDEIQLIVHQINPEYLKKIGPKEGKSKNIIFRNRIMEEFIKAKLLCEIEVSDKEYVLLCSYFKKVYSILRIEKKHAVIDVLFCVALVQIAIRNYDGSFWKSIAKVLGDSAEDISLTQRSWIGGTFTKTMLGFGKAIFKENEYVVNIMMHCFVTDNFAPRFFEYLYQYYDLDLERDITAGAEEESRYICNNIKNPYGKRKQFLSNYMYLSIRVNFDYCCQMVSKILSLIDQNFWNETDNNILECRLTNKFFQWINEEHAVRNKKSLGNGKRIRRYRSPYLQCVLEEARFRIILPSQFITDDIDNTKLKWNIIGTKNMILPCEIESGYVGNKTKEMVINVDAKEIFSACKFLLVVDNKIMRSFLLEKRKIYFFSIDGNLIKGENLTKGLYYAFALKEVKVESEAILSMRERRGVNFYELNFALGDLICIDKSENYYIGETQTLGLTREYKIPRMFLKKEGQKVDVYCKLPALIVKVSDDKFNGTAVIINGNISRLSEKNFINISLGKRIEEKYYYIDVRSLEGIHVGINKIIIDFPASSRKLEYEFGYLPGFEYSFEDAPYIYINRGTLCVNRQIVKNTIYSSEEMRNQKYDFSFDKLNSEYLILDMAFEKEIVEVGFEVPVLMYSFDKKEWFIKKPDDIWYAEMKNILYLKFPYTRIVLSIRGQKKQIPQFSFYRNLNGYFECDLTKMKSYFNKNKMIQYIILINEGNEYDIFHIVMRSFLQSAILEADYENECVKGIFDIIGKNDYYVDVFCNNELCIEKKCVNSGLVKMDIPIKSATYTIKVYECAGDEFGFDDDYDLIGQNEIKLIDSKELVGACVKANQLIVMDGESQELKLKYQYLIFIEKKINRHKYQGILVEIFHNNRISHATKVIIKVANLNNITNMIFMVVDYEENEYEFLYDSYTMCIVENENPRYSKSEAYRRYEYVLYEDMHIWKVQFVTGQVEIQNNGHKWIKDHSIENKQSSIWKNIEEIKTQIEEYID